MELTVKSLFSQLVLAMVVFKENLYSYLKNISGYRRFYLMSCAGRCVIMTSLSS